MKVLLLFLAAGLLVAAPTLYVLTAFPFLLAAALVVGRPATRRPLLIFTFTTILLAAFFYAFLAPGAGPVRLGPWTLTGAGFALGLQAGCRLAGVLLAFRLGAHFLPARELLPYAAHANLPAYLVGGLLRFAPTLRQDYDRIREAQAARGFDPGRGVRRSLPLLVPLFVAALRRTRDQALSLHLAGLLPDRPGSATPGRRAHQWALTVALAALAVAGRLALIAVPGVSLSFFVLFIAGVAYGPRIGLAVGVLSRLASDLVISGLNPIFLPMVFVEAFLGLCAGLLGRLVNFGQLARQPFPYAAVLAGTAGWAMTFLFSVAADTSTWLFYSWVLPDLDPSMRHVGWVAYVVRGLIFNVPSALFNALLFAAATYPVLRALRSSGLVPSRGLERSSPT